MGFISCCVHRDAPSAVRGSSPARLARGERASPYRIPVRKPVKKSVSNRSPPARAVGGGDSAPKREVCAATVRRHRHKTDITERSPGERPPRRTFPETDIVYASLAGASVDVVSSHMPPEWILGEAFEGFVNPTGPASSRTPNTSPTRDRSGARARPSAASAPTGSRYSSTRSCGRPGTHRWRTSSRNWSRSAANGSTATLTFTVVQGESPRLRSWDDAATT